jgi:hypothetical protein
VGNTYASFIRDLLKSYFYQYEQTSEKKTYPDEYNIPIFNLLILFFMASVLCLFIEIKWKGNVKQFTNMSIKNRFKSLNAININFNLRVVTFSRSSWISDSNNDEA